MGRYFLRRLLQAIPTFLGVTIISFLLVITSPGDPITLMTFSPNQDPEAVAALQRSLGLDRPPLEQYAYWLIGNDFVELDLDGDGIKESQGQREGLLRGDLGISIRQRRPVLDMIVERIPATLQLTLSALLVGYLVGIILGVISAAYQGTILDQFIRLISVVGNAIPAFWLGLILIILLSVNADLLPMSGRQDIRNLNPSLLDQLEHMIMPVTVLSLPIIANISRYTRTSVLEVLGQDYVRTARAKGLTNRAITLRHVVRNALIPVATFLGQSIGGLLGGTVIVEQVFSWPGLGKLVIDAVFNRDYPIVMGSVVIGAVLFIIGMLISDMLYALLDPRIRLE